MQFKFHPSCTESFYKVEVALDCLSFHATCGNPQLKHEYQRKIDQLIDMAAENHRRGYIYIAPGELPFHTRRKRNYGRVVQ